MIPGIVASGGELGTGAATDPYWSDVLLLIDGSKKNPDSDPQWANVLLLIDGSKEP